MENEVKNKNMDSTFKAVFDGVSTLADTKRVIGEPYTVGDTTIVPFIETSLAMGIGNFSSEKQAGGVGCKISPLACLVIQNGFTKVVSIKDQNVITKALDMIPDLVDKITQKDKSAEVKKGIEKVKDRYNKK